METSLTPSEIAIVDEIISAQSIEELVLLGQRLELIHTFSYFAIGLAILLTITFLLNNFKFYKTSNIFQILTGSLCMFIPSIPVQYLGSIIHLPLFKILGVIAIIGGLFALVRSLNSTIDDNDI